VLFVGDNLENPIPYLNIAPIDDYLASLRKYFTYQVKHFIPGHGEIATSELLEKNLAYLEEVKSLNFKLSNYSEKQKKIHVSNLRTMGSFLLKEGKIEAGSAYLNKAIPALQDLWKTATDLTKNFETPVDEMDEDLEKRYNVIAAFEKEISEIRLTLNKNTS
jgi:hypothetical protein